MIFPAASTAGGVCMIPVPDVCKTPSPAGPVPIPYPNIAQGSQAKGSTAAKKVKIQNKPVCTTKTEISMSSGDEAGSAGGVVSSKMKGPSLYKKGASKIKAMGNPMTHSLSMVSLNGGQNGNMPAGIHTAPSQTKVLVIP